MTTHNYDYIDNQVEYWPCLGGDGDEAQLREVDIVTTRGSMSGVWGVGGCGGGRGGGLQPYFKEEEVVVEERGKEE